jgi:hypothetical protein
MTKRPFGHGNIRNMGDFKAVQMDYEYYLTLEDVGRLYCLTDRQVYVLMVQLTYVGWLTRWYNTDDITQTTVGYIQSELMERLMSCVDISVLIDQAALNLVNDTTDHQIESQALRDILEDRYDGTPESINPNAPTTDFGSTGDRYSALCAGLTAFVYTFARNQADSVRAGQVGGLLAVALVAALLIPGLNFFFLVGASIAVVLGLGTIGVTTETAIAALTDQTALNNVVCCMRDNLKDLAVTEANWLTALGGCGFDGGSNEQIVADFLGATLASNYLTILNILGQAYTGVVDGVPLPDCPCEITTNCFSPNYAGYHPLGVLLETTPTYLVIQSQIDGLGRYGVEAGDTSRTTFCLFSGYDIVDGSFTPETAPFPEGFVGWSTGGTNITDRSDVGYQMCLFSYLSSTAFTIKVYLS